MTSPSPLSRPLGWRTVRTAVALLALVTVPSCSSTGGVEAAAVIPGYGQLDGYVLEWEPAEMVRPRTGGLENLRYMGPRVRLSGHLERRSRRLGTDLPDGMRLRVGIACRPGASPDWNRRPGRAWLRQVDSDLGVYFGGGESIEVECALDREGGFRATFPARLIERVVDGTGDYEVLLAVPDGMGPAAAARPASAASTLRVPGPRPLDLTTQRINAVVSPGYGVFDPVALVRAVNHLHGLGRDGALAALERYLERLGSEPTWPGWRRDPENIDTGHPGCVFPIVHLLFEPMQGRPDFPAYSTGRLLPAPRESFDRGDRYPLLLVDGLPFLVGDWADSELGPETDPERALRWAREHGRLRGQPLRPTGLPLRALETLESYGDIPEGNRPRLQLMRSFSTFVGFDFDGRVEVGNRSLDSVGLDSLAREWSQFRALLEDQRLRWNNSAQTYRRI